MAGSTHNCVYERIFHGSGYWIIERCVWSLMFSIHSFHSGLLKSSIQKAALHATVAGQNVVILVLWINVLVIAEFLV